MMKQGVMMKQGARAPRRGDASPKTAAGASPPPRCLLLSAPAPTASPAPAAPPLTVPPKTPPPSAKAAAAAAAEASLSPPSDSIGVQCSRPPCRRPRRRLAITIQLGPARRTSPTCHRRGREAPCGGCWLSSAVYT